MVPSHDSESPFSSFILGATTPPACAPWPAHTGALPGVPDGASDVELEGASADVVTEGTAADLAMGAAAGVVEGAGDVVLASPPFLAGVSGAGRGC